MSRVVYTSGPRGFIEEDIATSVRVIMGEGVGVPCIFDTPEETLEGLPDFSKLDPGDLFKITIERVDWPGEKE